MPQCLDFISKYSTTLLTGSMRGYIINKVKKPLMKAIITLAKRYPEPTRNNCRHPNTAKLFDIAGKFFEYECNPRSEELFRAVFRLLIAEYEHDPYYRFRFDWFLEKISESDWLLETTRPLRCWKGPERWWVSDAAPPSHPVRPRAMR